MKPSLLLSEQVALLVSRGLVIDDTAACTAFLRSTNYYRFSGYARYFQRAPHHGDDTFVAGTTFDDIRAVHDADEALHSALHLPLARAELLLRTHTARVIADRHGPYGGFLDEHFYTDVGSGERTVAACLRDIERSKDRHILRFRDSTGRGYAALPVWSAVEAWSFGTLSKAVERGARGALAADVASSVGVAKAGFAYRIRALVYLRNRCAHHARLWHHSVLDAGPTPNNVRSKAKRVAGQFEPRSVLDVIASLDDLTARAGLDGSVLSALLTEHRTGSVFWDGLARPQAPRDHHDPAAVR